jgi:hypothetical protein
VTFYSIKGGKIHVKAAANRNPYSVHVQIAEVVGDFYIVQKLHGMELQKKLITYTAVTFILPPFYLHMNESSFAKNVDFLDKL